LDLERNKLTNTNMHTFADSPSRRQFSSLNMLLILVLPKQKQQRIL